jgi:K+-sensing histidine kinase KdpD
MRGRLSRVLLTTAAVAALLIAIAWLDDATGYDLQFFVFYYLPVSLATWSLGRTAGLATSLLAALAWLAADVHSGHPYQNLRLAYWNGMIRLVAFAVIALGVSHLKARAARERALRVQTENALSEVKQLRGLLPICSSCKRVRDDHGSWNQIEAYVRDHTDAEFTHGLCPECARRLYPEFADKILGGPRQD